MYKEVYCACKSCCFAYETCCFFDVLVAITLVVAFVA